MTEPNGRTIEDSEKIERLMREINSDYRHLKQQYRVETAEFPQDEGKESDIK